MTTNPIHDKDHSLWGVIKFIVLTIAVALLLYRNASNFDETEIKTIIEIALMVGGYESLNIYLNSRSSNQVKRTDNTGDAS